MIIASSPSISESVLMEHTDRKLLKAYLNTTSTTYVEVLNLSNKKGRIKLCNFFCSNTPFVYSAEITIDGVLKEFEINVTSTDYYNNFLALNKFQTDDTLMLINDSITSDRNIICDIPFYNSLLVRIKKDVHYYIQCKIIYELEP